eukprot:gnl/TRDRNA2_/TRDRNA2_163337_c0_seq4.p1 gnl/TRDRNA2_/TRDRNA2_163337_c0~~gnl/TRDRNA2_/TRDRNA2_163337_c0_seq4.p1  ORF type:complete len:169 (+),score=15.26 gnl/TRDRNA2_/TRDRNA2_163337_c0_seq4:262-768(+)
MFELQNSLILAHHETWPSQATPRAAYCFPWTICTADTSHQTMPSHRFSLHTVYPKVLHPQLAASYHHTAHMLAMAPWTPKDCPECRCDRAPNVESPPLLSAAGSTTVLPGGDDIAADKPLSRGEHRQALAPTIVEDAHPLGLLSVPSGLDSRPAEKRLHGPLRHFERN